jgi:hypothetical protein
MAARTLLGSIATAIDNSSGSSMASQARTITAGSLVIVTWRYEGGSAVATSVTDTAGATYSTPIEYGTEPTVGIAYKWSHPGQTNNVATVNLSASRSFFTTHQIEFDGGDSSDPIDGSAWTVNGTGPSISYTATAAGVAVAMSGCFSAGAPTATSPAANIIQQQYSLSFYRSHSSSATIAATGGSGNTNTIALVFKDVGGGAPSISSASTTSPIHGNVCTLTGTGFGASQGTQQLLVGGIPQSVQSWSDTSIRFAVYRGTNKYGTSVNAEIWDAGALTSNSFALSGGLQPPTGWAFVNIGTPNTTASNRLTASPDLASGDQVAYDANGKPSHPTIGARVTVATDGTFTADPVNSFDFEVWFAP